MIYLAIGFVIGVFFGLDMRPSEICRACRDPKFVALTPILTTLLLESANIEQLYRMWTEYTAAGQSLWAWGSIFLALILWLNFYTIFNRGQRFAIYGTLVGVVLTFANCLTIVFFRYVVGR